MVRSRASRRFTLILSLVALTAGCESEVSEDVERMVVAPVRAPCIGVGNTMCLRVTALGDPDPVPSYLAEPIEGYTHTWGETVEIDYVTEDVEDPPTDGSSIRWIAVDVRVVSEEAAGTTFTIQFPASSEPWFVDAAGGPMLVDGTPTPCDVEACELPYGSLDQALDVEFVYDGDGGIAVRATTPVPL